MPKYLTCESCGILAQKHVVYGLPIAEALAQTAAISSLPYKSFHQDLCQFHILGINVKYVHFSESEIGLCAAHNG